MTLFVVTHVSRWINYKFTASYTERQHIHEQTQIKWTKLISNGLLCLEITTWDLALTDQKKTIKIDQTNAILTEKTGWLGFLPITGPFIIFTSIEGRATSFSTLVFVLRKAKCCCWCREVQAWCALWEISLLSGGSLFVVSFKLRSRARIIKLEPWLSRVGHVRANCALFHQRHAWRVDKTETGCDFLSASSSLCDCAVKWPWKVKWWGWHFQVKRTFLSG